MKKIIIFALIFALSLSLPAFASPERCAVIGADLTEEQIAQVYELMGGIKRGNVRELIMTNEIERSYLAEFIPDEVLGTRSISSVLLTMTGEDSAVEAVNISWCTERMYLAAMATAGIENVSVIVASPFEVSGTSALAGIYMAYEEMTGETISKEQRSAGILELLTTGELGQEMGDEEALNLVTELKLMLDETMEMSDEELYEKINSLAEEYNIPLNDYQREKLKDLCRSFEKLDADELQDKVEKLKDTAQKVEDAKDKAVSFWDKLVDFISAVKEFVSRLMDIFG